MDANGDCPIKQKEQSTERQTSSHALLFVVSGILYRHTHMHRHTHSLTHTGHKSRRETRGGRGQMVREKGRKNMGDRIGTHM